MSMKNSNDTIGNRTRDLPACSAVPQPTATPRAPGAESGKNKKSIQNFKSALEHFINKKPVSMILKSEYA